MRSWPTLGRGQPPDQLVLEGGAGVIGREGDAHGGKDTAVGSPDAGLAGRTGVGGLSDGSCRLGARPIGRLERSRTVVPDPFGSIEDRELLEVCAAAFGGRRVDQVGAPTGPSTTSLLSPSVSDVVRGSLSIAASP